MELIAAVQPLLVGAVLIWSGYVKLFSRRAAAAAGRTALAPLLGQGRAVPAYRLLGGVELALGAVLVLPPAPRVEALAATALAAGFLGYLGYARRAAPTSSCGCLSTRRTPITWRGFARAGLLLVAGLLATVAAPATWSASAAAHPLASVAVLVVEAAAVLGLSAELDRAWLLPLRRLRARLTDPLRGGSGVPLLASVQQLQLSQAYRQVAALLTSDVRDHWADGQWRIVCYAARYQSRPATAVFAVPQARFEPETVRVALVDEATGVNLLAV
ncbi:hypothetical protein CIK06_09585 [Plantactinospora sp. KBS50]|nr:hypothetical protein CIK06_09585 [Plantactinospora sp. KBS50]